MKERILEIFESHASVQEEFIRKSADTLVRLSQAILESLQDGGKVLFFGNGGSAADAQHLAAELVNRFRVERRALPGIALTTDTSVLTSIANDRDYDQIFSRQVEALGREGDVAVGISTSSSSPNVLEGVRAARRCGCVTIGLAGGSGEPLRSETDYCLVVPSTDTARIQEIHILAGHAICDVVEREFLKASHNPQ